MNRTSVNIFLTDMNISIESFELLQNKIIHIENYKSFIIIREDAFLSKEASNEEMASQDFEFHFCDTPRLQCKQQHYMRKLCVSEHAFFNWVGSRPVHIHTLN